MAKKAAKKSSSGKRGKDGLTPRMRLFCHEYLIDYNGTKAAIRAGYSKRTAYSIAHENLRKPDIQKYIDQLKQDRMLRVDITADRVLQQLARIAFADIREVVEWDDEPATDAPEWERNEASGQWVRKKQPRKGIRIKPADQIDGTIINEISETISSKGVTRSVKMASREAALEKLFRHLGLEKPQKIDVGLSLADLLAKAWEMKAREGGAGGQAQTSSE